MSHNVRMPAEWEPQEAVWLSWPVSPHIWPEQRTQVWEAFALLTTRMSRYQPVCINVVGSAHEEIRQLLNRTRCDLTVTTLFDHPTDDVWCRDHGPIWLKAIDGGDVCVSDWRFNAWGGKFEPFDLDDQVPSRIAKSLGLSCLKKDVILEGGAIESNGAGVLMTTASVLQNANRGNITQRDWEQHLGYSLGTDEVFWLPDGLPNDDTDGHIDNLARFTPDGTILAVESAGVPALQINRELLEKRFGELCLLPRPEYWLDDTQAPASYANFVVLNDAVLIPAFGDKKMDETAMGLVLDLFPGRNGEMLDSRLFIEEGGALHCLTNNQPSAG